MEARSYYHAQTAEKHIGYTAVAVFANGFKREYECKFKKDAQKWLQDLSWLEENNGKVVEKKIVKYN